MKNFLMIALVAVAALMTGNESALAGGGKTSSRADLNLTNNGPNAVTVWVRPAGTPVPATFGELDLETIAPGDTERFRNLRNGNWEISVFDSSLVASLLPSFAIVPSDIVSNSVSGTSGVGFAIAGEDLSGTVNLTAGFSL